MNRYPGTTQNLQRISPRASADKNLEPMQKQRCKRSIASRHCEQLRTVGKNRELRKKRKELQMQTFLPPGLLHPAVEASRLNLAMQVVNQRTEVKACRLKPHDLTINLHRLPKEVRGAGDQTKFQ